MLSKDDLVNELITLTKSYTEEGRIITRNFFREQTGIPDSHWEKHFGTFTKFKIASGLSPSKHETSILNDIAKHVSVDNYRSLNVEKSSWEGSFLRPSDKKYQSLIVVSDIHDINCDLFYYRLLLETVNRVQPERIILNGDIFDFPEFSKYTNDPREYAVVERIKWVHKFLEDLRSNSPNSQIDLIEGNHEYRLLRHLSESSPGIKTILSDLHGWTIPELLGLKKFEVNFYARADLGAFNKTDINSELSKNYIIVNDQVLFHHFPQGKDMGYPGCNGHHHKHIVWNSFSPRFGSFEWHQIGCGHKRQASYTPGEKWSNGFLIVHLDTKTFKTQFDYIDCSYNHCFIGGKFYERKEMEI